MRTRNPQKGRYRRDEFGWPAEIQISTGEEVSIMKYERPEVVALGSALDATRSDCGKEIAQKDCFSGDLNTTTAYEADE
jgi:hypothetical protein